MAIDDNTVYGLTGAQIKELPGKIDAVKGQARRLTAEDYNYPVNSPDGVALWSLPKGLYYCDGAKAYISTSRNTATLPVTIMVGIQNSSYASITVFSDGSTPDATLGSSFMRRFIVGVADGNESSESYALSKNDIVDNLTTTTSNKVLSANQGRVLKSQIGDLANLTTADKTNIVAAVNETVADSLSQTTTFWGRTANNGVVDGGITISGADGLPGMYIGYGQIEIDKPAAFYLRAKKNSSTYSNVLWWNSASNGVPSDVHLDAAETKMTLMSNEVQLKGRYSSDHVKISNVATPQNDTDAATKGYVDGKVADTFTTNEWNALWA